MAWGLPWAPERAAGGLPCFRAALPKSVQGSGGTPSRLGAGPGRAYEACCRSTKPADRQKPRRREPVGGIPRSGGPSHRLLIPLPDPLQRLSRVFCAGGDARSLPAEWGGQAPELDCSAHGKHPPRHQHPRGVRHHFLAPSCGAAALELPSFMPPQQHSALAIVLVSTVAAVRASSSRRFMGLAIFKSHASCAICLRRLPWQQSEPQRTA